MSSRPDPIPGLPLVVQLSFAGSRSLFNREQYPNIDQCIFTDKIRAQLKNILEGLPTRLGLLHQQIFFCGISQIAIGADTVFTAVCRDLSIPQRIFLPQHFHEYLSAVGSDGPDFNPEEQTAAQRLLESQHIIQERVVATSSDRHVRFEEVNQELARVADVMVCLVAEGGGRAGGSDDFIEEGEKRKRPLLEIRVAVGDDNQPTLTQVWHRREAFLKPQMPEELSTLQTDLKGVPALVEYCKPLKTFASTQAGWMRTVFDYSAIIIVGTHFLATLCAVVALQLDNSWLPWLLLCELLLLFIGFATHTYLHRRKASEKWSMVRLVAEVARSAQQLVGVRAYLSHMFTLPLPQSLRPLLRTLNVLHLRETRRLNADTLEERRNHYIQLRMEQQIKYYEDHLTSAKRRRRILNMSFVIGSISAMVATLTKLLIHVNRFSFSEFQEHRLSSVFGSLAIVLPVLAVAALSLAASRDLEARVQTFSEMLDFLDGHVQNLRQAKTDHAFATLALEAEARLLGETATWYSRRAFTGIS